MQLIELILDFRFGL